VAAGKRYIGEILVDQGYIKPEHLEEALREQKRQIGQILIDKGFLKAEDLDEALKVQVGIARSERHTAMLRKALVVLLVIVVALSIQFFRVNEQASFLERLGEGGLAADEVRTIIQEPGAAYKLEALRSLDRCTPGEREELLSMALNSDLWYVRLYAVMVIQKQGSSRMVPKLIPLTLTREESVVRFAAGEALERLTGVPNGTSFNAWLNYAKLQKLAVTYPSGKPMNPEP